MKFTITEAALAELDEAVSYLNRQQNGLGLELISEFERGIDFIRDFPEGWPKSSHQTRTFIIDRFHYGIVYRLKEDRVTVVAVAPLHRRPAYWKSRLRNLENEE